MNKDFEGYPTRQIRLSEEEWKEFKEEKVKFGKNWNQFIKHINNLLKK